MNSAYAMHRDTIRLFLNSRIIYIICVPHEQLYGLMKIKNMAIKKIKKSKIDILQILVSV